MAQNEPIPGSAGRAQARGRGGKCAKRTQSGGPAGAPEGETCETNPIYAGGLGSGADPAKRTQFPAMPGRARPADGGANVQNELNSGSPLRTRGTDYAKRTQFRRSVRAPEDKCAKRTQTWAPWEIWVTADQTSQFCETKPVPGYAGRGGGRGRGRMNVVQTNPIPAGANHCGLGPRPSRRLSHETNPILRRGRVGREACLSCKTNPISAGPDTPDSSMILFACLNPLPEVGDWTMARAVHYCGGSYFVRTTPPGGRSRVGFPWR